MPFIKLEKFSGISPRTGPTELADNQAQASSNVKLQSLELRSWRAATEAYTPAGVNTQTIYRFAGPANRTPVWLEWPNDVDVVAGPVADLDQFRLYYTSKDFSPKKTNWLMATGNDVGVAPYPNAFYEMGVPAPTGAPSLTLRQKIAKLTLTSGGSGYTSAPSVSFTGGAGTGATATASFSASVSAITLNNAGSGYSSAPTVTITGGGGTGAVATIRYSGGVSNSVVMTTRGTGYRTPPSVTFSGGGGSGATGFAVLSGFIDAATTITYGGFGYTVPPTVTLVGGGGSGATAVAALDGTDSVQRLIITNAGSGYSSPPSVVFSGGDGSGAVASVQLNAEVSFVQVSNGGSGYTSAPTVVFSGGGGSFAAATASLSSAISGITLVNGGAGYTSIPTVTISGGGGSGATATASISGSVTGLTLTNGGADFTSAPTVSFSGGGGSGAAATASLLDVAETRSYLYTHVTEFGTVAEESAPSPASIVECNYTGDKITLSGFSTPPTGNYNFKYRRIYRSVVGGSSTNYQLVAEIPIATSSFVDTLDGTALGATLTSLYFTPPPSTLQGIVAMPNGILAGFTGNEIWFCEPYLPHAWPSIYTLTTAYPIVGLGVFGNSLFVGTTKHPYLVTGSSPSSMFQEKMPMLQPCVSKKSIASDQFGVLYASPNGLVGVGPGLQDVISTPLYTRDEWQAINPSSMIGEIYNNMYFGFYQVGGVYNSIVLMRGDIPPLSTLSTTAKGAFVDQITGQIYTLSNVDNKIYALDSSTTANTVYNWKSKRFSLPKPLNFSSLQVHANYAFMAANAGSYINVKVYADGVKVFDSNITSPAPVRMTSGYKAYDWEIEFTGNVPLRRFAMATTTTELMDV